MPRLEFRVLHFTANTRGQSGFSHADTWNQDLALFEAQKTVVLHKEAVWFGARMCVLEPDRPGF